tara:strand:- start:5868 stop:6527 length:660 start_codon:yes stop_codon:yes gene_type:complete
MKKQSYSSLYFVYLCTFFFISLIVLPSTLADNETKTKQPKTLNSYGQKQNPYEFPEETGFEHPIGNKKITKGTNYAAGDLTTKGMSLLLEPKAKVELTIKKENYTLTITQIAQEEMSFTINSLGKDVQKGEKNTYDLNDDGEYDMIVLYHKQYPPGGRFADISFYLTNEKKEIEEVNQTKEPEEEIEEIDFYAKWNPILQMIAVLLLVIVLFLYVILKE